MVFFASPAYVGVGDRERRGRNGNLLSDVGVKLRFHGGILDMICRLRTSCQCFSYDSRSFGKEVTLRSWSFPRLARVGRWIAGDVGDFVVQSNFGWGGVEDIIIWYIKRTCLSFCVLGTMHENRPKTSFVLAVSSYATWIFYLKKIWWNNGELVLCNLL